MSIKLKSMAVMLLSATVFAKEPPAPPAPPPMAMKAAELNCEQPPHFEQLSQRLTLTSDQQSVIFAAMKQHCETMKAAHQTMADTMKHVLTPEQQTQLDKLHRERTDRRHEHKHEHEDGKQRR